jgi:hypothetical protein
VDAAIEIQCPHRELLAVLQLFGKDTASASLRDQEGPKVFERVRGKFELCNDTIIGYAKDGTKIIEPPSKNRSIRPDKHANSIKDAQAQNPVSSQVSGQLDRKPGRSVLAARAVPPICASRSGPTLAGNLDFGFRCSRQLISP